MTGTAQPNRRTFDRQDASDTTWTVARCNRLLRPIASRINTLRKEAELEQFMQREEPRGCPQDISESFAIPSVLASSIPFHSQDRTGWADIKSHNGTKRKYSNRSGNSAQPVYQASAVKPLGGGQCGEINVPTPCIRRIFTGRPDNSPQSAVRSMIDTRPSQNDQKPKLVRLAKTKTTCASGEGLGPAFEKVLIATKGLTPSTQYNETEQKGARSLFSTCLRTLPRSIAEEQAYRTSVDKDDRSDVSAEVYASLEETFELIPGRGWSPFRQLVLGHVVHLFKQAFEEHLLDPAFIRVLLDYCKLYGAFSEAQSILLAFAASENPVKLPRTRTETLTICTKPYTLSCLNNFVTKLFSPSYRLQVVANMLENHKIHGSWYAMKGFVHFVADTALAFSSSSPEAAAAGEYLVEMELFAFCGLSIDNTFNKQSRRGRPKCGKSQELHLAVDTDFQPHLLKFMTTSTATRCSMLCAVALTPLSTGKHHFKYERAVRPLKSVAIRIRRDLDTIVRCSMARNAAYIVLLAEYLLMITMFPPKDIQDVCIKRENAYALNCLSIAKAKDSLPSAFNADLTFVAMTVSNGSKDKETALVLQIIQAFRSQDENLSSTWSPRKLALDIALHYSQISNARVSARFAALAREIEGEIHDGRANIVPRPEMLEATKSNHGLRWEEGICEWVAADTPAGLKRGRKIKAIKQRGTLSQLVAREMVPVSGQSQTLVEPSRSSRSDPSPLIPPDVSTLPSLAYPSRNDCTADQPRTLFDFSSIFKRTLQHSADKSRPPQQPGPPASANSSTTRSARSSLLSSQTGEENEEDSIFSTASSQSTAPSSLSDSFCCVTRPEPISPPPPENRVKRRCQPLHYSPDVENDTDSDRDELAIGTPAHLRKIRAERRLWAGSKKVRCG